MAQIGDTCPIILFLRGLRYHLVKKKSLRGKQLFSADFDLYYKLEKCFKRVERGGNVQEQERHNTVFSKKYL